jgi:hypothetical protein
MDTALALVIVASVTLLFNIGMHLFGGGWKLSNRLSSIETGMTSMQAEIKKLGDVVAKIADMRGDLRVLDTRVTAAEQDIREMRHGRGFIQNRSDGGLNGEYP